MIQAVTTPTHYAEFARRIAGKPYFAATMETHCTLFGSHPASGWCFYLLPGTAALSLHGGTATLCGRLPEGEAGEEAAAELQGFLRFLRVDRLLSEQQLLKGWQPEEPLLLWELPRGQRLLLPPAPPPELVLEEHPAMQPVSRLVFPDSETEREQFYTTACTAIAHGFGCCWALQNQRTPVCTVGCYEKSREEAYMSAGVTLPDWQGRGLAGWLIVRMANHLAESHKVRFACAPQLQPFYTRLGFTQRGMIYQYTREWDVL